MIVGVTPIGAFTPGGRISSIFPAVVAIVAMPILRDHGERLIIAGIYFVEVRVANGPGAAINPA
jgi:hypothetical protein